MKLNFKLLINVCLIALFVFVVIFCIQFYLIFIRASSVDYSFVPYTQGTNNSKVRILFLGDSTGLGTGAISTKYSVSGWFGQKYPQAYIYNNSRNGRKLDELLKEFDFDSKNHYSLAVFQIGANDILKFTSYSKIEAEISQVINKAKLLADHVCILHSGNVGLSPVFIWPFSDIMTERSRVVRLIYIRKAKEFGVNYVDLFTVRSNDLFLKDIPKYYSADFLHPSGDGYHWWFERIIQTLDDAKIDFNQ